MLCAYKKIYGAGRNFPKYKKLNKTKPNNIKEV